MKAQSTESRKMRVTLIVGAGGDVYYELGLLAGLALKKIDIDFIGSDLMKDAEILRNENVHFFNLRGSQDSRAPLRKKFFRIVRYYARLVKYAATTDSKIFHIQWLNKFVNFDRVFLNIYYKILKKKLVFTAHNVNAGVRDESDTLFNRWTLRFMYRIVDHIIVHTGRMKQQLIEDFDISGSKVTVIQYGINDIVFKSEMTREQAREKLGLGSDEKVLLFFGIIKPYKGLEDLLMALVQQKEKSGIGKLVIAGMVDKDYASYWNKLQKIIEKHGLEDRIIKKIEFIHDREIERYFKAADVLILPYKYIFQSGILFLAMNFGLPVIATDVGSLKEFIIEGRTGYICRPADPADLAEKIDHYYKSNLFQDLEVNREKIIQYANENFSWGKIAEETIDIYKKVLHRND